MSGARSKAENLALVSVLAPHLREAVNRAAARRVARVDAQGNVVGYTTLVEVQKSLLRRHALEIELQPDERPREVFCSCGLPIKVAKVGRTPTHCTRCKSDRCSKCDGPLAKGSCAPWKIAQRRAKGIEPVCSSCKRARLEAIRAARAGAPCPCDDAPATRTPCVVCICVRCGTCRARMSRETHPERGSKEAPPMCRPCYLARGRLIRAKP